MLDFLASMDVRDWSLVLLSITIVLQGAALILSVRTVRLMGRR